MRLSTENRRYFLAAGNMNTCPKPNFFSKVLSQCVLEVAAVLHGSLYSRKTMKPTYSLASQKSHALFLKGTSLVFFINIKWIRPCWTLMQFKSTVHFWRAPAKFWRAKAVQNVKLRIWNDNRDSSAFIKTLSKQLKTPNTCIFCLNLLIQFY